jgi:hypothetical protein
VGEKNWPEGERKWAAFRALWALADRAQCLEFEAARRSIVIKFALEAPEHDVAAALNEELEAMNARAKRLFSTDGYHDADEPPAALIAVFRELNDWAILNAGALQALVAAKELGFESRTAWGAAA